MFGKKKEEVKVPEKEAQSWDDGLAAALPKKSVFFDAIRSDAYVNKNVAANYIEFWTAIRVDEVQDKWQIMHYMMYDMDQPDGKFKAEALGKKDPQNPEKKLMVTFPEAVYHISTLCKMAKDLSAYEIVELTPEKYPDETIRNVLKVNFFDVEHYKLAANIEGLVFDDAGQPYRRVEGKVVSTTTFRRSEIANSITAVEQARENPKVAVKIEQGVLADIFNTASDRVASLDEMIKGGESLACLDYFALQMGAFYLGIQKVLGRNDKFDKIQGLSAEEKDFIQRKAGALTPSLDGGVSVSGLVSKLLPAASEQLEKAKALGVHVEPYQKHVAECELYAHLLQASRERGKFQSSLKAAAGADMKALANMQASVEKARNKFVELGGTLEHFDRLQAWVSNNKKEEVPVWLPRFLDRYYDQRQKAMKKIQERTTGVRAINTMSAKVKPPIVE